MAVRKRKVRRLVTEHECVRCGKWFVPKRADAKYCSASCRVMASRERTRRKRRR